MPIPEQPTAVVRLHEQARDCAGIVVHAQPWWENELPWLIQGTTSGADMSLFGRAPAGDVVPRWLRLRSELGCGAVVHARQVHEADVIAHARVPAGLLLAGDGDGHITGEPGVLLTVSVADCVPIFIAAPSRRAIALLHGGWRGVAGGVLERGTDMLMQATGVRGSELLIHFGPAICGDCFEVGPEVLAGLGLPAQRSGSGDRSHVDLRAHLAERALALGVPGHAISVSAHCTRCGDSPFFSHRGGCRERQIAVMAVRPGAQ